jgi:hypothetical protein
MRWWKSRGTSGPSGEPELPGLVSLGSTRSGREVRAFRAGADELLPWWYRLRDAHPATQRWPVLLGPQLGDLCWALSGGPRDGYDDAATLARGRDSDLETLRAERRATDEADGSHDDGPAAGRPADVDAAVPTRLTPRPAVFTATEQDGWLGLVPAAHSWEVPGVLGWAGGLNYDIEPLEHVVTLRDWHRRFGAELVSLSDDQVLELLVADRRRRRPRRWR